MSQQVMENTSLFTNEAKIITQSRFKANKSSTLQPWEQSEVNPFLTTKYERSKQQRKKISSLDFMKFRKKPTLIPILLKQSSREIIRPSKQLPKLNIGLSKPGYQKKSKTFRYQSSIISPIASTQFIKKQTKQLKNSASSVLLPTVSRQLNITRKIFLLQSKLNGSKESPSPQRKREGTIRRLVQKQVQKNF